MLPLTSYDGTAITSANIINTGTADPQITTSTSITSDKQYKGIDLSSGTQTSVTVSNNATAGIVGSTVLNNNTITVEAGSTFDQLNDNDTNTANFSAKNGTLNLANNNTASGSNSLGTLNITSASAEITGSALSVRAVNLDSGENLTLKNTLNFDTSSAVQSAGTLTLDGATLNSGTGSLNLGTIASGSSNSKINVTAGTTSATATAASKVSIDVATAATFNTAATSTLDTVTLKGSTSSNTAHLSIAAGTTTLDELVADGHGTVSVTKDASLTVSTDTTVGTGTATDQDSAGNNTLTIQEDHTSSGSVSLGALTLGNGTLIIDDSNTTADVLTISADSLTLTGASMLCGNDAGVIHKLKVANNTLTDAGKYLYYNSTNILLVGSDGTTPVPSANLRDTANIRPTLTAGTTISSDCEYAGINFTSTTSTDLIIIQDNATIAVFGNSTIAGSNELYIGHGATLNQLNDQTTHTADFTFDSTRFIVLNGTLNLANTNSTGNTNYISMLLTANKFDTINNVPYLIANNVTVNQLGTIENSILGLQGKISVNELMFNANNDNGYGYRYISSNLLLNQAELTLSAYSKSYPHIILGAMNSGNKLTSSTEAYYSILGIEDGALDIYSTNAKQYLGTYNNKIGQINIIAKTTDATLTLHDSHGTLLLGDNINLTGTSTGSTTYTATLDASESTTNTLDNSYITIKGTTKIITDQTQQITNLGNISNGYGGTLCLPRNSENTLAIGSYNSYNGTLNLTGATGTTTTGSNTITVEEDGSLISQGTIAAADGTVSLANNSTLTVNGTSNEVGTVEANGTVTINGDGTVKVKNLSVDANTVVQIAGNATLDTTQATQATSVGKTVITGSAILATGSSQYSTTVFQTTGTDDGTTNVTLKGEGEATSRLTAASASFETTTSIVDMTIAVGGNQTSISSNTLKLTDSALILGSTVYITGVDPAVNDSHIEVLGAAAGNTSTIDNHKHHAGQSARPTRRHLRLNRRLYRHPGYR